MKINLTHLVICIACALSFGCGGETTSEPSSDSNSSTSSSSSGNTSSSSSSGINNNTEPNTNLVRAKVIYQNECEACHTPNGSDEGLAPAINNWQGTATALVEIIEMTMPLADTSACDLDCAKYTAAYILAGFTEYGEVHPDITFELNNNPTIIDALPALPESTAQLVYSERSNTLTPLRIEAEHFDNGGANISFYDLTAGSESTDLRPQTDVDIEPSNDENGGHNVGWFAAEEWLAYSFENSQAQALRVTWRVATVHDTSGFKWFINDTLQGEEFFAHTGGWQNYIDLQTDTAKLDAGWHTLKIEATTPFNINHLSIERSPDQPLDAKQLAGLPATIPLHRLSNTQYRQTISDLFQVEVPPEILITDNVAENFDRIANILNMNEVRLEQYYKAAEFVVNTLLMTNAGLNRIMLCELNQGNIETCGREIVNHWLKALWREKITESDISKALEFLNDRLQTGNSPNEALSTWLQAILVSGKFLHHIENNTGSPNSVNAVQPEDLADRLSYFLWCGPPDEELNALATNGEILKADIIEQQVERMLAAPQAKCLVESFVHRWLHLNSVFEKAEKANLNDNPNWVPALAKSMIAETQDFLLYLIRNNISVHDLLGANYTFIGDALADYYQLPRSSQDNNRVDLSNTERQGLLTQGAILLLTGSDRGTAFIKRGVYTLEHILCDGPPLPPANIDQSQNTESDTCLGCHKYINPIGYGLDHFDSLGRFRDTDSEGSAINATGNFFNGPSFNGATEMINILQNDERVAACVMEKFYGYAHARIPHSNDDEAFIESLLEQWRNSGLGMSDLIKTIATSPSFTHYYSPVNSTAVNH